jgi:hypothetical protein
MSPYHRNLPHGERGHSLAKLKYHKRKPYFSTLTKRYYSTYDAAFQESLHSGGGADIDFNLYLVHPDGTAEIVY